MKLTAIKSGLRKATAICLSGLIAGCAAVINPQVQELSTRTETSGSSICSGDVEQKAKDLRSQYSSIFGCVGVGYSDAGWENKEKSEDEARERAINNYLVECDQRNIGQINYNIADFTIPIAKFVTEDGTRFIYVVVNSRDPPFWRLQK